jgi:hypothetical protein
MSEPLAEGEFYWLLFPDGRRVAARCITAGPEPEWDLPGRLGPVNADDFAEADLDVRVGPRVDAERAAIVAWLRAQAEAADMKPDGGNLPEGEVMGLLGERDALNRAADAIERGEHLQEGR